MIIHVKHVLGKRELQQIRALLQDATFRDGKLSAGMVAGEVKNNEELANEKIIAKLNAIVMNNLVRHPEYQRAVLPCRVAVPFYARYKQGMYYGEHIDDSIMGEGDRYRSDVAVTVFLNAPEKYDGGELAIQTPYGTKKVKYPAGDAVLYPATMRHEVTPVTSGERLVAVTWAQSIVPDSECRELLYQLNSVREKMLRRNAGAEDTKCVDNVYTNLVRMWSRM